MKVLVLGAGGIVGQHMLISKPSVEATFVRRTPGALYKGVDLESWPAAASLLEEEAPDVVVNLAGEGRVDVVESDPQAYAWINVGLPSQLAAWCNERGKRFIQASSQAVFSGENPPYGPHDTPDPITWYGRQKARAEELALEQGGVVARLTFVVGIRPFPGIGRSNPAEQFFGKDVQVQVNDRWFSPLFAADAARCLWGLCREAGSGIVHLGTPVRVTRFDLATWNPYPLIVHRPSVNPVSHSYFEGLAPRPVDTTWAGGRHYLDLEDGMWATYMDWRKRNMDLESRAQEIALFLQMPVSAVKGRLALGFGPLHAAVAEDFRRSDTATDEALLEWYRTTDAYIWELSAYHLDIGFNYGGMCSGIADHLFNAGIRRVLCLGDGIGDLTIAMARRGLQPTYHDLAGSRTADFAQFRQEIYLGMPASRDLTESWEPTLQGEYEAIVALDFFEHLINVEDWARTCVRRLAPGGLLLAQNAFACGDEEHGGSIPMHLTINNRFEHDWDPLLESLGMKREEGGWWRKVNEEVPAA